MDGFVGILHYQFVHGEKEDTMSSDSWHFSIIQRDLFHIQSWNQTRLWV